MHDLGLDRLEPARRYRVVIAQGNEYESDFVGLFVKEDRSEDRALIFDLSQVGEGAKKVSCALVHQIWETNQKIRGLRPALAEMRVF